MGELVGWAMQKIKKRSEERYKRQEKEAECLKQLQSRYVARVLHNLAERARADAATRRAAIEKIQARCRGHLLREKKKAALGQCYMCLDNVGEFAFNCTNTHSAGTCGPCADAWIRDHQSCPICRKPITNKIPRHWH